MTTRGIHYRFVFLIVMLGVCIAGCRDDAGKQTEGGSSAALSESRPVYLEAARSMTFASVLTPIGDVRVKNSASVAARVPGILDDIFVDEGDIVVAGKTSLFQTDALKLTKGVEAARMELAVNEYGVMERLANLEQLQAAYNKARLDYERHRRLYEKDKAVTASVFEVMESQFLQAAAAQKHAEHSVGLARKETEQARANLMIAEKDLDDSLVRAPISGVVTRRLLEPGEMAAAGTPVLRIEDVSVVEISAFLPEEAYADVIPGSTAVTIHVGDIHLRNQVVSYKSPTVNPDLRTFEIRCLVRNPQAGVVPGRIARLEVLIKSREGVGVPRDSIVSMAAGPVVFIREGDQARMVRVETGLQTDGWIEIVGGDVLSGAQVVTAGKDALRDGDIITVIRKDR
ncbi:MAG TPA: efflux RND transporter periplasmic adaptor subunit [Acidobacteriota bacterium]|nr:efflux RND transporter periplasmic adaptor subunit [Acidobacteriota bacterium]